MSRGRGPREDAARRSRRRLRLLARAGLVATILAAATAGATWAAFRATATNAGDRIAAGTVKLTDDDSGSAMLSLTNAKPYATDTSCLTVTYSGSLPAQVRLYGTTTGTGLDAYMTLTVTRGTSSSAFDSCATFTPDATDYLGQGAGVIYSGTLHGFPDDFATGLHDPKTGSEATWTSGTSHAYKFVVSLPDSDSFSGLTASQSFTWEARNT